MAKRGIPAFVAAVIVFSGATVAQADPSPLTVFDILSSEPAAADCETCGGRFAKYVFRPSHANAILDDAAKAVAPVDTVPVPAALPLLGMALAGLGTLSMRRRKHKASSVSGT